MTPSLKVPSLKSRKVLEKIGDEIVIIRIDVGEAVALDEVVAILETDKVQVQTLVKTNLYECIGRS